MNFSSFILAALFALLFFVHCENLTKPYTSYRLHPFCNPSGYMRYPTNSDEVVAIVNYAKNRGVKVKAFGSRHSQSDIICTEGIPVDMTKLKLFRMEDDDVTATFGAGVTLGECGEFLFQHGRALKTTPAYSGITIGGAIGTGAHGSSVKYNSSLSAQVVRMTVVDGLGQKLVISDADDLKSFKTHLGLLGIVVDVTLHTVPLYKVLAHNYVVSDAVLTNGDALNWIHASDQIMFVSFIKQRNDKFYWFPAFKEVVVANLTFVDAEEPGDAYSNIVPPSYGYFNFVVKKAKEIAYSFTSSECAAASTLGNSIVHAIEILAESSILYQTPGFAPIYTENGITIENPAVGFPHLMLSASCSEEDAGLLGEACLWSHGDINANLSALDNEFGIAVADLKDFVLVVKDIQEKTPIAFPLQGIIMRFSGNSDIHMSTAYQRDTAHIEFFVVKRENPYDDATGNLAGYQTIAQTLAKRFAGRSHWGKSGFVFHNREMLDLKLDPLARESFVAAMTKFDPNGIFLNNFGRRLKKTGTKIDLDPSTTRCALLDNCFCSENSDCADSQRCTTLPGYTYPVCKTINEVPEQQLSKSSFPPPLEVLDWLSLTVPTLVTAVLAKCSLGGILDAVPDVVASVLDEVASVPSALVDSLTKTLGSLF